VCYGSVVKIGGAFCGSGYLQNAILTYWPLMKIQQETILSPVSLDLEHV